MIRRMFRSRKSVGTQRFSGTPFSILDATNGGDYRGVPTLECPCGSNLLLVATVFDPDTYLPGLFMTDVACAFCGSLLTVADPTLLEVSDEA